MPEACEVTIAAIIDSAAYVTLGLLGFLLAANVFILGGRIFHYPRLAERVARRLLPIVTLFRVGGLDSQVSGQQVDSAQPARESRT